MSPEQKQAWLIVGFYAALFFYFGVAFPLCGLIPGFAAVGLVLLSLLA